MSKIQLVREATESHEAQLGSLNDLPEPSGKIGYGIKFDIASGTFDVVRHNDSAGEFIKLKDDLILNNDDYVQVVWSDKLLEFAWNTTYPGHLQVKIV